MKSFSLYLVFIVKGMAWLSAFASEVEIRSNLRPLPVFTLETNQTVVIIQEKRRHFPLVIAALIVVFITLLWCVVVALFIVCLWKRNVRLMREIAPVVVETRPVYAVVETEMSKSEVPIFTMRPPPVTEDF
jgi:hypothetical protein